MVVVVLVVVVVVVLQGGCASVSWLPSRLRLAGGFLTSDH